MQDTTEEDVKRFRIVVMVVIAVAVVLGLLTLYLAFIAVKGLLA